MLGGSWVAISRVMRGLYGSLKGSIGFRVVIYK